MDIGTMAEGGGIAGVTVLVLRIVEKIPWSKLRFSKNGKDKKTASIAGTTIVDQDRVRVLIAEHKEGCMAVIRSDLKDLDAKQAARHAVLESIVTKILLKSGGME